MIKVGDKIKIILMNGEPQYSGKTGILDHIDDIGQIHGSWGVCAIIPYVDKYEVIEDWLIWKKSDGTLEIITNGKWVP